MKQITEAGLKLVLLGGTIVSAPLYAGDKLPTTSCQDRENLLILRRCDPYSVRFLRVTRQKLQKRNSHVRSTPESSSPSTPRPSPYQQRLSFQKLVEKYIDYEENILQWRRTSSRKKPNHPLPKKTIETTESKTTRPGNIASESDRKQPSKLPTLAEYLGERNMETMLMPMEYRSIRPPKPPRQELGKNPNETSPSVSATGSEKPIRHTVAAGETFSGLARRYRTTVFDIRRWNHLKRDHLLKIGEQLTIHPGVKTPPEKIRETLRRERFGHYRVKKGDSVIAIARRFRVGKNEILQLNNLTRRSHLRIGQKLMLPLSQKRIDNILKKERRFTYTSNRRFKHKLRVVATAYTSHRGQTDRTPFLAAWNNRIRPGMKIIAVSPDLIRKYGITNGTKVKISGLPGIYTVRDKMHHRMRKHIDIYMGTNRKKALRWGRRRVVLYW